MKGLQIIQIMLEISNFNYGILKADQDKANNSCRIGRTGSPILQVAQKAIAGFQFLAQILV